MRLWGVFSAVLFCLAQLCAQEQPDVLILTNVNIVDTRYGAVQENHTVVIQDGRIVAIARHGLITENRKVQVINATGKYLIPGLWDMHAHTAGGHSAPWDEHIIYPLYVANGVTGIRDMGGDLSVLDGRRGRVWSGNVVGPHILMAGHMLNGGKSDAETIGVNNPSEARAAVDTVKTEGGEFVNILSNLSRDSYFAILDEAGKQRLTVVGRLPESVSAREASAAGQKSIENLIGIMLACSSREKELRKRLMDDLAGKNTADYETAGADILSSYDQNIASALFTQLAENATWQVPTLSWWRASAIAREQANANDLRLRYVPSAMREKWQPESDDQKRQAALQRTSTQYMQLTGMMRHAGVPFMAGTEGPDANVVPGFSLHEELELMTQAGFTNLEALQAATYNPAVFMKKTDLYGVVELGRIADLVLLDGDPLADIRNTRKIEGVVLGGRYFNRAQLDRMLTHIAGLAQQDGPTQRVAEPVLSPSQTASK
jgi:hypothetical protein